MKKSDYGGIIGVCVVILLIFGLVSYIIWLVKPEPSIEYDWSTYANPTFDALATQYELNKDLNHATLRDLEELENRVESLEEIASRNAVKFCEEKSGIYTYEFYFDNKYEYCKVGGKTYHLDGEYEWVWQSGSSKEVQVLK